MSGASLFGTRVAGVFATRVAQFTASVLVTFLLARLLGPAGRGQYALVTLAATTLFSLAQLGLPSATVFYAGRGYALRSIVRHAALVTVILSAILVGAGFLALPFLERNILRDAPDGLVRLMLLTIPLQFAATLAGSILYGRQAMRAYNVVLVGQAVLSLGLVLVLVGLLGLDVPGAVAAYAVVTVFGAAATAFQLRRLGRREAASRPPGEVAPSLPLRRYATYGLQLYAASITSFFNYRADVFLINGILASASAVGIYGVAVNLAEMTFYVPDSIATVFFPRVAASTRAEADRIAPMISRFSVMLTALAALALVPASWLALHFLLPAYGGSMPVLLVLLPGVVSLSLSKVLAGYLTGLGRALPVTLAATTAAVVNVAANLVAIPIWGIVGAGAASLLSYGLHAGIMLFFASRSAGCRPLDFIVPGRGELVRLRDGLRGLLRGLPTHRSAAS